jgi:hypothetical protein
VQEGCVTEASIGTLPVFCLSKNNTEISSAIRNGLEQSSLRFAEVYDVRPASRSCEAANAGAVEETSLGG